MTFLNKIPGPFLIFLGALCLSFGGIIVKSFEGANLWQILFWRQIFFSIIVALYLLFTYKKNFFKKFYDSGFPGFIAGASLSVGFAAYVFAMYTTTVANTNFIITTETIFLAFIGYFFLKEKINLITLISIILGMSGVLLILGSSLSIQSSEQFIGNLVAFIMPLSFAVLVLIIRKYPKVDMIPAVFYAGILSCLYGLFLLENFAISTKDIWLAFLLGVPQLAFGFIFITIGSRTTPAVMVGLLMLMESIFAPIWVWLFYNEIPPISVLIGGIIILSAVVMKSLDYKKV